MKKKIDSPFRKLKVLLVLPLVAMVFYAFAKPEYITPTNALPTGNVNVSADGQKVKGKVVNPNGKPLHGTSVVIAGTTIGTIADADGNFKLNSVPKDAKIAFSFVGFKTVMQKPDFDQPMTIKMVTDTVKFEKGVVAVGYSPLPALASNKDKDLNSLDNPPLYIVDGKIIEKIKFDKINTDNFESVFILKDKQATDKYGAKGKNGVVEAISKKDVKLAENTKTNVNADTKANVKVETKANVNVDAKADVAVNSKSQQIKEGIFVVVEEMPEFPGGEQACKDFIVRNLKYPIKAMNSGKTGKVAVTFIVNKNGKVENAKVIRGIDPALDAEVVRVVNSLPDWKPGKQRGTAVDIVYTMPFEFQLQ